MANNAAGGQKAAECYRNEMLEYFPFHADLSSCVWHKRIFLEVCSSN